MLYNRLEFNFALRNFAVRIMNDEIDAVYKKPSRIPAAVAAG